MHIHLTYQMNENNAPRKKCWEWLRPSHSDPHLLSSLLPLRNGSHEICSEISPLPPSNRIMGSLPTQALCSVLTSTLTSNISTQRFKQIFAMPLLLNFVKLQLDTFSKVMECLRQLFKVCQPLWAWFFVHVKPPCCTPVIYCISCGIGALQWSMCELTFAMDKHYVNELLQLLHTHTHTHTHNNWIFGVSNTSKG
ncbi:uncharacterized protein F5147DRAFT_652951 [Suillus discolor]|uniref:Uncharacterized protein n=1 Tax=Suillus discolor TaxID=1912936 RepID=A0A9P7F7U1_9AGAM|nr:uncharacterized protein F5147DRAFT_652951 [Suillus discolor]KAG2108228.1 hypothetical protein F5147DRAFT_652951 [Suillus discolor]